MKTPAEIEADIAWVLANPLTAKRAKDFRESGDYEVRNARGELVATIFRDPESKSWYENTPTGKPQTHYTDRFRGHTQKDALASIGRKLRYRGA